MATFTAPKETVIHMILIHVDVLVVKLLFNLAAVFAWEQRSCMLVT